MCVKQKECLMSVYVVSLPITRTYMSFTSNGASNVIKMLNEEESRIALNEQLHSSTDSLPAIARLALNYGNGINRNSYLFIK